jgi:hypothetical protein
MKPWPKIQQRPAIMQREFRGVNKLDPFSISDAFASDMKNLTSSKYPALTTRLGYTVLGTFGTRVLGVGAWKDTELHAVFNDGTWRRLNADGTWTTLASGLSTTAEWTFTNYMGNLTDINLIGSNGTDSIRRYDGITVQNLTNAPTGGNYITTYQNRLWCFVDSVNELQASSLDKADDWNTFVLEETDSFRKTIESPSGEKINGLFGELSKLTISFPRSIKKLLGGVPSDFNDQSVSQSIGIVNNKSAVTIDGLMHLYSTKGFYQYGGGVAPEKTFSQVVQYYADNANAAARTVSAVGSDGKNMYFSIGMDGATPDTILVYDQINRVWNVWNGITALHFARMGNDFYIGDASGRVLKLGGITDNGAAITSELVSKWFTANSMSQGIRWLRMWLTADLPTGSTLTVYLNKSEDEAWEQVGSITASSDIQRKAIYVASNKVINAKQLRYKIVASGPYTLHEVAWESISMPLR